MPDPLTTDDEDFRKRYGSATAGMPSNLAAVASANLAAQDAATAKVNAAARLNPLPTPGTAYATPETNAQNYGISDAMDGGGVTSQPTQLPTIADAHVSDIADRRSQIADQKKEILAKLGVIKPQEAGYAAIVLAPPKEHAQLLQTWHLLDTEDNNLLREHHDTATLAAHDAHENFARETHIQSANDFAAMARELTALHQNAKPGTPEFQSGALAIAANHPNGFATKAGQTLFRGVSSTHDRSLATAEALKQARDNFTAGTGLEPGSVEMTAGGGINIRGKPAVDKTLPANLIARYARLKSEIGQHEEQSAAEAEANTAAKMANVPYSKAPAYHAAKTEVLELEKRFPELAPAPEATPSATPIDRTALAKQALADPTASEAHKAAARKILGL